MTLFLYLIINTLKIKLIVTFKSSPQTGGLISVHGTKDSFSFRFEAQQSISTHFKLSSTLLTN